VSAAIQFQEVNTVFIIDYLYVWKLTGPDVVLSEKVKWLNDQVAYPITLVFTIVFRTRFTEI